MAYFFHQDPRNSWLLILRGQDFLIRMLTHSDRIFDSLLEQTL
jgi:hypothetical protein